MADDIEDEDVPPGWYPNPDNESVEIFWDGSDYQLAAGERPNRAHLAVEVASAPVSAATTQIVSAVVVAASIIGAVLAFQETNLLKGMALIWTGAAIAAAAAVAGAVMKDITLPWVREIAIVAAIAALWAAFYVQNQMDEQRAELQKETEQIESELDDLGSEFDY